MNAHPRSERQTGQVIVIFALALVAIIAMVGLVLDGGSSFAQRRDQQNIADIAALAGANDLLLGGSTAAATAKARAVAAQNGYPHGAGGVAVNVSFPAGIALDVKVDITKPHRNAFAGILGMSQWDISTTATALTGLANTGLGAGPMIFSIDAFDLATNAALPKYANAGLPWAFGDTNNDAPETPGDFAWTNYGTGNVNSNEVRQIIQGRLVINKTIAPLEYIGQHNNGFHTTLFGEIDDYLRDQEIPVPIVDHDGHFLGWAMFHVVSAEGGSTKKVNGYFTSGFNSSRLTVGDCPGCTQSGTFGTYVLKLVE